MLSQADQGHNGDQHEYESGRAVVSRSLAAEKSAKATTPQESGEAIQAGFEMNTMAAAAPVAGLSAERYSKLDIAAFLKQHPQASTEGQQ